MNPDTISAEPKPKRSTSIPLLAAFVVIGLVGWLYGEQIMAMVFYYHESTDRAKVAKEYNTKAYEDAQRSASAPSGAGGEIARKAPVGASMGGGPQVATPGDGNGGGRGRARPAADETSEPKADDAPPAKPADATETSEAPK